MVYETLLNILFQIQRKLRFLEKLEEANAIQQDLEVSADDIIQVIENFKEEVRNADPKIRKKAIQTLSHDIWIHPKKGNPWERKLEVTGQL